MINEEEFKKLEKSVRMIKSDVMFLYVFIFVMGLLYIIGNLIDLICRQGG